MIRYPNNISGVYRAHGPAIQSVLRQDGQLNLIGPDKPTKHWNPKYLMPDGLGPGSANHGVLEAAVFSGASHYWYDRMRQWWLAYLAGGLNRHCGREARSGIYMQAIWMAVGTQLVNADRRMDQETVDACRRWLDSMWALCALSAYPVKLSGKWRVTGPGGKDWGGTGIVIPDERWTVTARGQRSWHGPETAGIPSTGFNLALYRAATGTGRMGVGEPFKGLLADSFPGVDMGQVGQTLVRVVNHPEDTDNLRRVLDLAPGMHDGCEFVRFERGALTVTTKKVNGNTAPAMSYAVDDRGDVECLVVHPPRRPARGPGKAHWDSGTRTVRARGGLLNKKATLNLPVERYGPVVYHVKFPPNGGRPVLVYPEAEQPPAPGPGPEPAPPRRPSDWVKYRYLAIALALAGLLIWWQGC